MEGEIFFNNKRHISSKRSGEMFGYTHDYVSRLCREGKVSGRRIGKTWYAEEDSLRTFLASNGQNGKVKTLRRESQLLSEEANAKPNTSLSPKEGKQPLQNNSISSAPTTFPAVASLRSSSFAGTTAGKVWGSANTKRVGTDTYASIPSFAIGALLLVAGFVGGHIAFNTPYPALAYEAVGRSVEETGRVVTRGTVAFTKAVDESFGIIKKVHGNVVAISRASVEAWKLGYERAHAHMSEAAAVEQMGARAVFSDVGEGVLQAASAFKKMPGLFVQNFYEIEVEGATVAANTSLSLSSLPSDLARTLYDTLNNLGTTLIETAQSVNDTVRESFATGPLDTKAPVVEEPPKPGTTPPPTQPVLTTPAPRTPTPSPIIIQSPSTQTVIERTIERVVYGPPPQSSGGISQA
ncbi:MAG: hypothetical protein HY457_02280, partial [Parcubacteria group bacterium]|nr:hypothetical protein [Parcubacteria group bacterium]